MKKVTAASGDYLLCFHPLTIVSNVFMRKGTYQFMFIDRLYNTIIIIFMGNGTYPLMFIDRVHNIIIILLWGMGHTH